ncbi:hypothetical protein KUW19_16330 [Ferrimonas balearica]|uniref:hypothetical protein n=1 Tax=Ferrimonas balearica TaxID=44012 RepID=UPI001C959985|nr:hypothetical protein [Ferrimonas balearica]MBY6108029.1 hypothetical protein [Ferrimonas balearica]
MLKFIQMLLALMACPVMAQSQWSVGTGYQYGGVLGVRYNVPVGEYKQLSIAVSPILGVAMGYQQSLDDMAVHALGFSTGFEEFTADDGFVVLTYNYYPDRFRNTGWSLGVDAGIRTIGSKDFLGYKTDRSLYPALFINLGYQF